MQSKASTVAAYLDSLPPERRSAIATVRGIILANLDGDYEEGMQYGAIGYYVPHRVFPAGYHCNPKQPLPYAGLASQKNYMSLYLMCQYSSSPEMNWFQRAWAKAGKKLDMGKSCIRFKRVEDLALEVLGEAIRRTPAKKYLAVYQQCLAEAAASAGARRAERAAGKTRPAKPRAPQRAAGKKAGPRRTGRS